jgi:hypothetical protein
MYCCSRSFGDGTALEPLDEDEVVLLREDPGRADADGRDAERVDGAPDLVVRAPEATGRLGDGEPRDDPCS